MVVRLIVSMTLGVFVTTFIIRSLSVEDYGIYTVLYSMIGYVSVIGSFGIPAVFQRFIPEAFQKKEYSLLKRLVLRGLVLRLLLSLATIGFILLLNDPIGRLFKIDNFLSYYSVFAWSIVLSLEATLLTKALHSLFLHKYSVIASTLQTVFRGTCVFVLLQMGWGIRGILWAEAVSWGMSTLLLLTFYYIKFARLHINYEATVLPLRRYFRYGVLSALNALGASVRDVSTDFFVIAAFLGPEAVALYAFAHRVLRLFLKCLPHVVLSEVIQPFFFAKYVETRSTQHLVDMFNLLLKLGAFSIFPLAAGIFVLGHEMIPIVFKPEYLPATPILWTLVTFVAINIFITPTNLVLRSIEKNEIILYSRVFSIYNLVMAIVVIQWHGVMGVVLVTCSANLATGLFLYYHARKLVGLSIDWRGVATIATNATGMALVVRPLQSFITGFTSLAFVASVGVASFLLFSWLNQAFRPEERRWINRVAPRPVFVF